LRSRANGIGWAVNTQEEKMHARVATFEGGETDKVNEMIEEINRQAGAGPPEVPIKLEAAGD
jgi:hypothetical protein